MANLPETEDFAEGTYQIETSDRVIGGPGGIANKQAEQLGNRTAWLKAAVAKIISGTTAVGKAAQLATARTLKFKGAVSGSLSFDGSADAEVTLALADSGVVAGTYTKVTLNAKGLITSGSNPTTLSGYGITDAIELGQHGLGAVAPPEAGNDAIGRPGGFYFFGEGANSFALYASVLNLPYGAGNSAQLAIRQGSAKATAAIRSVNAQGGWTPSAEIWTDANFNPGNKADKATTLGGYGISDAYTKSQTDSAISSAISGKADKATTLGGYGISDAYTKAQTDSAISSAISGKADKATTLGGYGISDAYTRPQVDVALGKKFDKEGGTVAGALYVNSAQSLSSPALSVDNEVPGSSLTLIRLRGLNTSVLLSHRNGTNVLSFSSTAGDAATLSAGDVMSSGSPCHTAASFMKPVAGQWVSLTGGTTLPAGGTWAYQITTFNATGTLTNSGAGLIAGGSQLGTTYSVGFAWRIQ